MRRPNRVTQNHHKPLEQQGLPVLLRYPFSEQGLPLWLETWKWHLWRTRAPLARVESFFPSSPERKTLLIRGKGVHLSRTSLEQNLSGQA